MSNFFKEIVRTEPHSLDEIRASLDQDLSDHKQLVPLLKEHHNYLEESISFLLDPEATEFEKQEHLERFFRLVQMHGKAEQETLYRHLKENSEKEARIEGFSGQSEHDIVFQLEEELNRMGYKNEWNEEIESKAKVVAGILKNHMKEEERTMFTIAESHMTEEELELLRDAYIQKCIGYFVSDRANNIFAGEWTLGKHSDSGPDSFQH